MSSVRRAHGVTRLHSVARALTDELLQSQLHHLRSTATVVIDVDEGDADEQRQGQQATGLDVGVVLAERSKQGAHVVRSPVVDLPQSPGDSFVVPGPIADRKLNLEQFGT